MTGRCTTHPKTTRFPHENSTRSVRHPAAHWLCQGWLPPLLLFGAALLLRVLTLGWGLPYVEHPDEPALVRVAVRMVQNTDFHPYTFHYPSFYFYLLAGAIYLHGWWGMLSGAASSLDELPRDTFFYTTVPGLYVWLRAIAALAGAATVALVYPLGKRLYDWRVGTLAGVALLVNTYHIEHSQYITTDVATGLWTVLVLLGAWNIASQGAWSGYLLAGAAVGLATGTKYNALAVAVCVAAAHLHYWREHSGGRVLLRLVASGGVALLVFLLTTPYALLDWSFFLDSFRRKVVDYSPEQAGAFGGRWPFDRYARFFWHEGLMASGIVLLLMGLPALVRRFPTATGLLLLAVAAELLLLLSFTVHFTRNVLPIFPLLVLLSAAGVIALADLLTSARVRRLVLAGLILLLLLPQVADTGWLLRYRGQPHTMAAAAAEVRALPRGMLVAVDSNPVQWAGDPVVFPLEHVCAHSAAWYRARGFRYLIINEDHRNQACAENYQRLLSEATPIATYPSRSTGLRTGPGGAVLDLGEHLEQLPFVRRPLRFANQVQLLGYELQPGDFRSQITPLEGAADTMLPADQQQVLMINLYWRVLEPPPHDYWLFLHVLNEQGERVAQRDAPLRENDYPASRWQAGELVIDRADMLLPPLPPGRYRLEMGVYVPDSGGRLEPQTSKHTMGSVLLTEVQASE